MKIVTKKLRKNCWEMYLIPAEATNTMDDITAYYSHDHRVSLIDDELRESDATMYSKQAWDRWHWYDKDEMTRFITFFTLKHGDK